jgi:molecular chaperone DnaK (HSP70)
MPLVEPCLDAEFGRSLELGFRQRRVRAIRAVDAHLHGRAVAERNDATLHDVPSAHDVFETEQRNVLPALPQNTPIPLKQEAKPFALER